MSLLLVTEDPSTASVAQSKRRRETRAGPQATSEATFSFLSTYRATAAHRWQQWWRLRLLHSYLVGSERRGEPWNSIGGELKCTLLTRGFTRLSLLLSERAGPVLFLSACNYVPYYPRPPRSSAESTGAPPHSHFLLITSIFRVSRLAGLAGWLTGRAMSGSSKSTGLFSWNERGAIPIITQRHCYC